MSVDNPMVTSSRDLPSTRPANERAAELLVALMAIGEMSVGMVILALPREVALLLVDASLDGRGPIVARMMGIAVLALGITWWMARAMRTAYRAIPRDSSPTTSVSVRFSAGPLSRPFTLRFHGSCAARILVSGLGFGLLVMRSRP